MKRDYPKEVKSWDETVTIHPYKKQNGEPGYCDHADPQMEGYMSFVQVELFGESGTDPEGREDHIGLWDTLKQARSHAKLLSELYELPKSYIEEFSPETMKQSA